MLNIGLIWNQWKVSLTKMEWCCIPVIVDVTTSALFEMPAPDEDPDQQPVFWVTQATVDLVPQDFELYKPSLQRMADDWRAAKKLVMQGKRGQV